VTGVSQGLSVFLDGVRVNEPGAEEVNFDLLPLEGQVRVTPAFVVYQRSFGTADDFELPPDTGLVTGRVKAEAELEP